jgi:hypothetical protein
MRNRFSLAFCITIALGLFWPSNSLAQASARTLSRSLDQLIDESDSIVHGFVVSSRIEPHPQLGNLMTEVVTVKVADTYKGKPLNTLVFRQYVWNTGLEKGTTDYHKSEELVLLLRPASEYGLTSPAGLEQGRFRITLDRKRRRTAVNGRDNAGLFYHLEQAAQARNMMLSTHLTAVVRQQHGSLLLTDLEQIIRSFARSR